MEKISCKIFLATRVDQSLKLIQILSKANTVYRKLGCADFSWLLLFKCRQK